MIRSAPTVHERLEAAVGAARVRDALSGASRTPYWLDSAERPDALPALEADTAAALVVVGGGFAGLWSALMAARRNPERSVLLLEAQRIAWAASGRNGGFADASLVHGEANGERHLPRENARLGELGLANLDAMGRDVAALGIECGWARTGTLNVAMAQHELPWLAEMAADEDGLLTREQVQQEIRSPLFLGGFWDREGTALVDPARLAWGLRSACLEAGVRIHEHTPVTRVRKEGAGVVLSTPAAVVRAERVVLATNVFPSLLPRLRKYTVPVYDHALMTEPLTDAQEEAIGWEHGAGLADLSNRFHYARPTRDTQGRLRILYGGYDALHHPGGRVRPEYDQSPATQARLAAHFLGTFPQLGEIGFSHAWGGAIDTCSRFFCFFDTALAGHVVSAAGFTGLGVAATRFAAEVMLDLLSGEDTELTRLQLVRRKPLPFPPEPLATVGVGLMTRALIRADRRQGRRGLFLKTMDTIGMGFDS